MDFSLVFKHDIPAESNMNNLCVLSDEIKEFLSQRNYGESIQEYLIGVTCVFIEDGYEHLFKQYKPFYVEDKISKNRFTGENIRIYKSYTDSIVLTPDEYEDFVSGTESESLKIVSTRILKSLENLNKLPKKVKDFDVKQFKEDVTSILSKYL